MLYLSGIDWLTSLLLLVAHAAASAALSYHRTGKAGDTARRVTLITGAASGIGRALCKELIEVYDDFVIATDVSQQSLDELAAWHRRARSPSSCCSVPAGMYPM